MAESFYLVRERFAAEAAEIAEYFVRRVPRRRATEIKEKPLNRRLCVLRVLRG